MLCNLDGEAPRSRAHVSDCRDTKAGMVKGIS
jgi:hypothetical protein